MILFLSNQTVGVKVYDNKHKFLYDYSISQKDNIRVIQINFANGIGVEKKLELNSETGTYELVELKETSYISNIVDLNQYSNSIINQNLLMCTVNKLNPDGTLNIQVSFRDRNAKENLTDIPKYSELLSIR